ncbi:Elongation factor Ts [Vitis vinifera]|uniref:Elongation factor Ts, mitochondrial n=1 Tax=Vitis vinifera TaxID=29760 RepID=A0A438IHU6_VITVI|nr:Elongation factor Ts [Vitis vinifera]
MTPVIPSSISNISLISGTAFTSNKNNCLTRCYLLGKSTKQTLSPQRFLLPLSTSVRLFPQYRSGCTLHRKSRTHILSATGTDVAVEQSDSPATEDSSGAPEVPSDSAEASEGPSIKSDGGVTSSQPKRARPRKSEMPPVKNEELVPGATFTGKVKSIQPFGAFIDFGAFTDGLVHVSRLSDSYVKDVGNIVSIGQEVKVRLVEANTETGRISLTMRDSDDPTKPQQQKDAASSSDKPRPSRRNTQRSNQRRDEVKKTSKFVKGEEGFLPTSEEADEGFGNLMGGSSLQVGQEVSVRVLRISRGQVTLTMKKEEDAEKLDLKLGEGVVHTATNPFVLAFRKNKEIATFLDEREKTVEPPEIPAIPKTSEEIEGKVNQAETVTEILEVQDQPASSDEKSVSVPSAVGEKVEGDETPSEELDVGASAVDDALNEMASNSEDSESVISNSLQSGDAVQTIEEKAVVSSEVLASEGSISTASQIIEEASATHEVGSDAKSDPSTEIADQILSSESLVGKEVEESQSDDTIAKVEVQIETLPIVEPVEEEKVDPTPEKNGSVTSSNGQTDVPSSQESMNTDGSEDGGKPAPSGELVESQILSSESQDSEKVVENQANDILSKEEVQIQTPAAENEIPSATPVEDEKVETVTAKNNNISNSDGQTGTSSPKESTTKATISPALVKKLREDTGAGMMDCKKALSETGGDIVKAQEFLRKKGLASADNKASRATAEGRIGSYVHDSRIGILIEVNCETDFVARGDIFKELVDDLAMQAAACPQVQYLVTEDVPEEIVNKEREIEMQKEDLLSKPEQIRSRIVEGRIKKRLDELALLEQPYIKNDKVVVKDWKSQDFAAEVAAQTAATPPSAPGKEQPAAVATNDTAEKPPTVTVSAALVKQLREETGAGMMDCKKALSETGGDLEKAQEYLRMKGLSTADKKSSRLAAEGRIGSYIHDSRIGVLIEVNCETDFVGRSEKFKELVDDLAMQVVACPQVQFVSMEDIAESIVSKEKEIEMQREDLQSKPENIREKIVEGRVAKRLGELALLEQAFIKDDSILVKDLVKQTVAALGENIKVRRLSALLLGRISEPKNEIHQKRDLVFSMKD